MGRIHPFPTITCAMVLWWGFTFHPGYPHDTPGNILIWSHYLGPCLTSKLGFDLLDYRCFYSFCVLPKHFKYVYIYIFIYIYLRTYIHTYIHTYIYIYSSWHHLKCSYSYTSSLVGYIALAARLQSLGLLSLLCLLSLLVVLQLHGPGLNPAFFSSKPGAESWRTSAA